VTSGPVLIIGLDAADLQRIERLVSCGGMPNLAGILGRGVRGRLRSSPAGLSAMIWPKWFEGGHSGSWYFPKAWNPDRMRLEWVTATRGDPEPFWRDLDRRGLRTCIVDVPQAPVGGLRNGVMVQGWQVHDLFERRTAPSALWAELRRAHGVPVLDREHYGLQSPASLLALREQLLAATTQAGDLGQGLLKRGSFDLFVMVLGGLHRGGHYLWDLGQVDARDRSREDVRLLEHSLDDVYQVADHAVGQLVAHTPPGTRVIVLSLHGMGPNYGWSERLQSFAGSVFGSNGNAARATPLQRLKRVVPSSMMQRAFEHLPVGVANQLLGLASSRMHDWQQTRWFVLPSDLSGFLRLNLRGREASGLVGPGAEARAVEEELIECFSGIEDLEGRRIVAEIERTDDSIAATDRFRRYLPDLLLIWDRLRASDTAGLRLNGRVIARWDSGRRFDSGRSGNHITEGWFAAIGPGLSSHDDPTPHDISGIVPSVYRWLGLEPPAQFVGTAIESLAPPASAPQSIPVP